MESGLENESNIDILDIPSFPEEVSDTSNEISCAISGKSTKSVIANDETTETITEMGSKRTQRPISAKKNDLICSGNVTFPDDDNRPQKNINSRCCALL